LEDGGGEGDGSQEQAGDKAEVGVEEAGGRG
jgi:hypothetical protein